MIGRGWKKEKRNHHWQESKINCEFDNEMNGTQLIRNLNWFGRTNDLIEKMEIKVNDSSSMDEIDEDVNEERKKSKLLGRGSLRKQDAQLGIESVGHIGKDSNNNRSK